MQFLAITRRKLENFAAHEFDPLLEPEAQIARGLYLEGVFRQIWHRADIPGACLLLEAASLEAAQKALEKLPLVQKGMLEVSVLLPLKPYAGFGPRA